MVLYSCMMVGVHAFFDDGCGEVADVDADGVSDEEYNFMSFCELISPHFRYQFISLQRF